MNSDKKVLEFVKVAFFELKEMINDIKSDTHWIKGELEILRSKANASSSKEEFNPPATDFQNFEILEIKDIPMTHDFNDTQNAEDFMNEDENTLAESTTLDDIYPANEEDDDERSISLCDAQDLFPIQNVHALNKIERQIENGELKKYAKIMKDITGSKGLKRTFHKLFDEQFLLIINFNGSFGRINLGSYRYFLNALCEALKGCPEADAESDIAVYVNSCLRFNKSKYYRNQYKHKISQRDEGTKHLIVKNRTKIAEARAKECKELLDREGDDDHDIIFPLNTFHDIEKLNARINKSNRKEYIETLKVLFRNGGIEKCFNRFITEDMIQFYNYDGVQGKLPFKKLENILDIIHGAIIADAEASEISEEELKAELKNVFSIYKKKIHRRNHLIKRKSMILAETSKQEAEDEAMEANVVPITHNEQSFPANEEGKKYKHKFPLRTKYAMDMMEKMITPENKHKYVKKFKEVLGKGGLQKNFNRIVDREFLTEFNLTGQYKKTNLQDYKRFLDVLYEASYAEKNVKTRVEFGADLEAIFEKRKRKITDY